jgi:two-component system chemotaxis response regulator CheY
VTSSLSLKVLVVDNSAHARTLTRAILEQLGPLDMHECADGPQGLDQLRQWDPDIVLVDYAMHPMNGLEFTRRVRSGLRVPDATMPILLMTEHADLEHIAQAMRTGVDAVVVKPLPMKALTDQVRAILVKRAQALAADAQEPAPSLTAPEWDRMAG